MDFEDLTDEQKAKAKSCNTPEEMLALAQDEGYELSIDELDGAAGGWCPSEGVECPLRDCTNF